LPSTITPWFSSITTLVSSSTADAIRSPSSAARASPPYASVETRPWKLIAAWLSVVSKPPSVADTAVA